MAAVYLIVVWILPMILASVVGGSRGQAGIGLILGLLFSWLGVIIAAILPESSEIKDRRAMAQTAALVQAVAHGQNAQAGGILPSMKSCPYCAEEIRSEAIKCKHCGSTIEPVAIQEPPPPPATPEPVAVSTPSEPLFRAAKPARSEFPLAILIVAGVAGIAFLTWWLVIGNKGSQIAPPRSETVRSAAPHRSPNASSEARRHDGVFDFQRCTPAAECPKDYAASYAYLEKFCSASLTGEDIELLRQDVASKRIGLQSLLLLFNVHGALYGVEFKRQLWLNSFFYGTGEWLPGACREKVRSYARAMEIPPGMTATRDLLQAIWKEALRALGPSRSTVQASRLHRCP